MGTKVEEVGAKMSKKLFASLPLDTVIYLLMSRNWLHDFGSPKTATAQSY